MMKPFTTCVETLLIIVLMFSDSQLQGLLFVYDIILCFNLLGFYCLLDVRLTSHSIMTESVYTQIMY